MSIFSSVLLKKPGRNKFDLGYTNTLSMNMGALVPVLAILLSNYADALPRFR